ncbi:FliA/WhiG family RNA polymerase sigma factor [bacterium]|nr:MAG: FliA/WhiG family RNA polymerase sigma factor [bacterium]
MSLQDLVDAYCEEPTMALKNAIITKSVPLVRSIVGKISKPDTPLSQFEDLESAGMMGLIQALDNYSKEHQVQFNTFAYYRIRGNIVDYLRKIDQVPRLQRAAYGKAQTTIELLMQKLGRYPNDEEVANEMGISLEEYSDLLANVQQRSVLSLNDYRYGDEEGQTNSEFIPDEETESPDAELERLTMRQKLEREIKKLKEREQLILALYYFEDLTLKEIAAVLGLTEARISQILGKLLLQLKVSLNAEALQLKK